MDDVIPHFLNEQSTNPARYDDGFFENVAMRMGEVVAVYPPEDPANAIGTQTQYVVRVQHRNGRGMLVDVLYRCTMGDLFGGIGDHVRYVARKSTRSDRKLTNGSRVLIGCPNGETNAAVIIGGVKHPNAAPDQDGLYFDFEFNGVKLNINENGEVVLSADGATDTDGNVDGDKSTESNREASITISPKTGKLTVDGAGDESIEIDTAGKSIHVRGGTGDVDMDAWKVHAGDVSVSSDGNAKTVATGEARIDGSLVKLGGAAAISPIPLGDRLTAALSALATIIASIPSVLPPQKAALAAWAAALPAILSHKSVTE